VSLAPTPADWLNAGSATVVAAATIVLVGLAYLQMRAANEQAKLMRETAARQVLPLVYAHQWKGPQRRQGEVALRYYLTNEGLGAALNLEHGVLIRGARHIFGHEGAYMFRTAQPGESLPPRVSGSQDAVPPTAINLMIEESAYFSDGRLPPEVLYWCRYEDLFGERWETRNSDDPTKAPKRDKLG